MSKNPEKYKPEVCECCGQSTTYVLPVDRGSADIVIGIARAIKAKGINEIHPRKEMEVTARTHPNLANGEMTSNQINNLSRPRSHGLIAKVRGRKGFYCLTHKGIAFLKGEPVHKYAIMSKAQKKQVGYWQPFPEGDERNMVSIKQLGFQSEYWEGIPN